MAQHAQLGLLDGESTPVNHVFDTARASNDFASWENRVGGIFIGYEKLSMQMKRPSGPSNSANRELTLTIKMEMPVLETLGNNSSGFTPPPTVAHRPWVEVIYHCPDRSSKQQRKNLHTCMRQLHSTTQFIDFIENFAVPG